MRRSQLTTGARRDVATILAWSEDRFGKRQRRLYPIRFSRADPWAVRAMSWRSGLKAMRW